MRDSHAEYNLASSQPNQTSEMNARDRFVKRLFRNESDDIPTLKKMGITESAIIAYIVRVGEGMRPERALKALLAGRRLTDGQVEAVKRKLEALAENADRQHKTG